ncbi:MAG: ATP-binding protein [Eubacteriales bacterium]|nr:ATP-binding protein [Eubacteriales bacterium]
MEIITGKIDGPQKVLIYGPEGIGKTTLASKFPNPIFIDTEGSTKHLDVARTPAPSSWTMLLQQVKWFRQNPNACDTVIIDTADWAEKLCIAHLCDRDQKDGLEGWGYGKGYTYLEEEFGRLLNQLTDLIGLGINVTLTAHAWMRKFEQPDELGSYDRWELKLQKKTAPLVREWADMILFCNYETHVVNVDGQGAQKGKNKVQGGKRVMHTTHHPCWDAKNRHDLPEKLPLEYAGIAHCIPARPAKPEQKPEQKPVVDREKLKEIDEQLKQIKLEQESKPEPESEVKKALKKEPEPMPGPAPEPPVDFDPEAGGRKADPTVGSKIPRALLDLMESNHVAAWEIQAAVASRGYYPQDMAIPDYDPDFISGCLVGAWDQMFDIVEKMRADKFGDEKPPF